jgi:hypothetical protein
MTIRKACARVFLPEVYIYSAEQGGSAEQGELSRTGYISEQGTQLYREFY